MQIENISTISIKVVHDQRENKEVFIMMNKSRIMIGERNGFVYSCLQQDSTKDIMQSLYVVQDWHLEMLQEEYMYQVRTNQVGNDVFESHADDTSEMEQYIVDRVGNLQKKYPYGGFKKRLVSDRYEGEIIILYGRDSTHVFTYVTDEVKKYTAIWFVPISINENGHIYSPIGLWYSTKHGYAKKVASSYSNTLLSWRLPEIVLNLIFSGLQGDPDEPTFPVYGKEEVQVYKAAFRGCGVTAHAIHDAAKKNCEEEIDSLGKITASYKTIGALTEDHFNDDYPMIRFTLKEDRFVDGYCKKNNLLCDDPINIIPYFENPRYGNEMKIDADLSHKNEYPILMRYDLNTKCNTITFHFIEPISYDNGTYVEIAVTYDDIDHFAETNLLMSTMYIVLRNHNYIPRNINDIKDQSVLANLVLSGVNTLVSRVIKDYIAIHDRPKRSRMVKQIRRTNHPSRNNKPKADNPYVISHILMPINEAKSLVASSKEYHERAEAQYVLEEWERSGYTRVYKSGRHVWIGPTTCHRHLPLTDKEVVVKL